MNAGKLNNRVILQRLEAARDEYGELIKVWVNIGEVWANIKFVSGREYAQNGLDSSSATISIQTRVNSLTRQVDNTCRILFKSSIFNIEAVLPDVTRRDVINFACSQNLEGA